MKKYFLIGLMALIGQLQAQRNTVLIIADDLSPDYFGFYGYTTDTVNVPNIRRLLAKGIRFDNFTSNPVCSSTRTSILTGRYSFRTGVGGIVGGTGGSNQIDTNEMSIPKLLKLYNPSIVKANIGKWHLKQPNPPINLRSPLALGFNWHEGPFIGQLPNYFNWTKYTNGVASTITNYATSENVNNAVTWVKAQNRQSPFFLWLAFNAPHEPLHLPPSNLHSYSNLTGTNADINNNPKAYFKAMIQAMDHEIGRLMDSLKVLNKLDSTDFIFIGDNGNTPRTAQIADVSKAKGTVYEYGVHVPLIISGPTVVNPKRVSKALVNSVDLFATIIENFGFKNWQQSIPVNKPVDSKSLMPIIKQNADSVRPWAFCELFKLTTDSSDGKAIKNKQYKLIRFDYGAEVFFNLIKDSLENSNLLTQQMGTKDIVNYQYLCNEMNTLLGKTSDCKTAKLTETLSNTFEAIIAPNPSNDKVYITFQTPANTPIQLTLFDAFGHAVYSRTIYDLDLPLTIDIKDLSVGLYSAVFKSSNHIIQSKLIVE